MRKLKSFLLLLISGLLLCLNLSCDKVKQSTKVTLQEENLKAFKVSAKDIDKIKYTDFALSNLSEKATKDWLKFQELQNEIVILKKGDLSFFKDDNAIVKSLLTDLKNEIPDTLNIPAIMVRLSVLETTIYKLEGMTNFSTIEKEILLKAIKEVFVANSNVILQMNKKLEKDSHNIEKPN